MRRGSALLMVLLTIIALSVLVMSFVYEANQYTGLNLYVQQRNRVLRVVDAGRALAEIVVTKYKDVPEWSEDQDTAKMLEDDRWFLEKQALKSGGSCRIGPILLDDARNEDGSLVNPSTITVDVGPANDDKININTLWKGGGDDKYNERWWMIFKDHGIPETLETPKDGKVNLWNVLIASWDDWRDEDDLASEIDGEDCGAETEWYEKWERDNGLDSDDLMEYRRRPRNGIIPDIHELENIRGFKEYPAILTGGVINPWEDREEDQIRVRGILDVLSADGPAKINVNSCMSTAVLLTVPGIYKDPEEDESLDDAREAASLVVQGHSTPPESRDVDPTKTSWPYKDWSDLSERVGADNLDSTADRYFSYNTDQFTVTITGSCGGMSHSVSAKCYVKDGKVRYYEWCENPVETADRKAAGAER